MIVLYAFSSGGDERGKEGMGKGKGRERKGKEEGRNLK